jgi:hypothetical protein
LKRLSRKQICRTVLLVACDLLPGDPPPAIDDSKICVGDPRRVVRQLSFKKKKKSPGPKNTLEKRITRFSTMCADSQALN